MTSQGEGDRQKRTTDSVDKLAPWPCMAEYGTDEDGLAFCVFGKLAGMPQPCA